MVWRATGPGKFEIDDRYRGAGILKALLYNFDFDDMAITDLKTEHAGFLRTRAVPLLAGDRGGSGWRARRAGSGRTITTCGSPGSGCSGWSTS